MARDRSFAVGAGDVDGRVSGLWMAESGGQLPDVVEAEFDAEALEGEEPLNDVVRLHWRRLAQPRRPPAPVVRP